MLNGITDIVVTVSVPKPEYEELVRDSEQLSTVKKLLVNGKYVSTEDLKIILDIERDDNKPIKSLKEMLGEKEGEE